MKPKEYWKAVRKQRREAKKAERKAMGGKPSARQFNNVVSNLAGYSFSSKLEAAVFQLLQLREAAGEIKDIKVQDSVYLTNAKIQYIADFKFTYCESGDDGWAEAKGFANEKWPIKRRLWISYGPGILEIYKGTWQRPELVEKINPKAHAEPCLYCGKS